LNKVSPHPVVFTTLRPRVRFKTFTLNFGLSLKAFRCSSLIMNLPALGRVIFEHNET